MHVGTSVAIAGYYAANTQVTAECDVFSLRGRLDGHAVVYLLCILYAQ